MASSRESKRELLLTQAPARLMVRLSLPAIVGMVVVGLYTFVDAIYVGQFVGATAMGAVAVAYPFTFVNGGLASLMGMGSASVLARAIGANDQATIDKVAGNLVVMNIVLSLLVTVLGVVFARELLALAGAEGEMLDLATSYLRIIFLGSLFVNFGQSSNMIMRGEGELVKAMLIMGASAVLNIVLAPAFILAQRDAGLGVEGAAWAPVLSQVVLTAVMLWWFVKREKVARIHAVRLDRTVCSDVLRVGFSAFFMQVLTLVQQAVIYRTAAAWGGAEWQILFGAALRIQAFGFIPLWGISQGFQPAAGTNYGARCYARVRKLTLTFAAGATALALVFWVPAMLAPEALLSLFITDPSIVAQGAGDFRVFFSTYLLLGLMIIGITLMQALGKGGKATLLTLARPLLVFVPMVLLVPSLTGLGIHGVWLASALSDGGVAIVAAALMAGEFRQLRALECTGSAEGAARAGADEAAPAGRGA